MSRKKVETLLPRDLKRLHKKSLLKPIFSMVRRKQGKLVRLNDLWDDPKRREVLQLEGVWNTRAFFLQDCKRYCEHDIEIEKAQKSGTFAKKRD